MSFIVDRRLNGKNKSTVNRQRFLKRYREHIREAVNDAVNQRSITDMENGEQISIPKKDISEPVFHHGPGGERNIIHPGNREFQKGDRIKRPPSGGGEGSGEGEASADGEGMDDFVFNITQDEFLDFLFEDLELPNLVRKKLASNIDSFKTVNAGVVSDGIPAKINIVRSMRQAVARRKALTAATRRELKKLVLEREALLEEDQSVENNARLKELDEKIGKLREKIDKVPWLDTYDLRYNHHVKQPKPISQAVMFCLMDVSGSMNQSMKDIAKRFFILLYMFLQRNYEKIDVVFIRHHTSAKEVDEHDFFYSRETGGTIVSSALKLMRSIIEARYPTDDWNIYTAQASDGDNWNDDSPVCSKLLREEIMPLVQYYSYVEITPRRHQALWHEYEKIQDDFPEFFAMEEITSPADIFPVFRNLFSKKSDWAITK